MKKLFVSLLIFAALLTASATARAQVFVGGVNYSGTSNSVPIVTNTPYLPVRALSFTLTPNNTNLAFAGNLMAQYAGSTNLFFVTGITNIWSAGTSNSWSTNISAANYAIPQYYILQGQWGTNIGGVFYPTNIAGGTAYVP